MIRAAIVGLGRWGQNLVNSVRVSDAIRFTTAHTRTQATAAGFCADAGLRWVSSLDAILDDDGIDAVVFATPHTQHSEQVIRAAQAGKHVFMEKPFSLSLAAAIRAKEAADKAGNRPGGRIQPALPSLDGPVARRGDQWPPGHPGDHQRRTRPRCTGSAWPRTPGAPAPRRPRPVR